MIIVGINYTNDPIHLATTRSVKTAGATIYDADNNPIVRYDPEEKVWRVSDTEKYSEIHFV